MWAACAGEHAVECTAAESGHGTAAAQFGAGKLGVEHSGQGSPALHCLAAVAALGGCWAPSAAVLPLAVPQKEEV